jgi:hypothetical protein
MRIGRLFIGKKPTNEAHGRAVLASWSYVTGYWRWALYRSPAAKGLRFGPCYSMGKTYFAGSHFAAYLNVPLIGYFNLSTQPPMPAMKTWGKP